MTAMKNHIPGNTCVQRCSFCKPFGWIYKDVNANLRERLFVCENPMAKDYCHMFHRGHRICGFYRARKGRES